MRTILATVDEANADAVAQYKTTRDGPLEAPSDDAARGALRSWIDGLTARSGRHGDLHAVARYVAETASFVTQLAGRVYLAGVIARDWVPTEIPVGSLRRAMRVGDLVLVRRRRWADNAADNVFDHNHVLTFNRDDREPLIAHMDVALNVLLDQERVARESVALTYE